MSRSIDDLHQTNGTFDAREEQRETQSINQIIENFQREKKQFNLKLQSLKQKLNNLDLTQDEHRDQVEVEVTACGGDESRLSAKSFTE